jgi:cyclopropane fatty-acyl-phospholipid synthase-like methyltransferase
MTDFSKPHSPACDRNRGPILQVLRQYLGDRHRLLEIGSGTGQHAVYFAAEFPQLIWQCSDLADNLPAINRWLGDAGLPNTPAPLCLDVTTDWPRQTYDVIFTANSLHIMDWSSVERLFTRLPAALDHDGLLIVYGPFNYGGRFTSDSNGRFDDWLKARGPHQGIRNFESVDALAQQARLKLLADHQMPANNRTLIWRQIQDSINAGDDNISRRRAD